MKKLIFVKVPGEGMTGTRKYMHDLAHRLEDLGVTGIKCWSLPPVMETPKVKCRFIYGNHFDNCPKQYHGLMADELFFFTSYDHMYVRRYSNVVEAFKGGVIDYILEQEGVKNDH